jgi:hypothetical protein
MGVQFASGKHSIAMCDRCGQQYKLKQLKKQIVKQRPTDLLVCPECLDVDHPQLMLGSFPVYDPEAVRDPRVDNAVAASRDFQWGWNPVGGARAYDSSMTPNNLIAIGQIGTVTVITD